MTQNYIKTNNFSKMKSSHNTDFQEGPLEQDKHAPAESQKELIKRPSGFPEIRLRRTRQAPWSRHLVAENNLSIQDLIWPAFVIEGQNKTEDIPAMPGVQRYSIDLLVKQAKEAKKLGIPAIAVFPVTSSEKKNAEGSEAINPDNLICRAIKEIKNADPDIGIIADVALDPYTDHGHDGLLENGKIHNDKTLDILGQQALVQAQSGVDVIAPSDMMDGRIAHIRGILEDHNFTDTLILSYAAKYASAFYGPFRDAVQSSGCLKGDKSTYQMDPANRREAMREVELDIQEGADMVMIKPGLPYLDVINDVSNAFQVPVFAYNVSGEYSMLKLACEQGILDHDKAVPEMLLSFKRAGAQAILSYFSMDVARLLNQ